ncbi:hypothetical protein C7410_115174 [Paraburkholderia silvatlantica]|uniref:N-acetyltransferase domain-containing protein n=1 Tax=Paraburkholderia silvatlantica TaxID=321895 RepID=A0A2V4TC03_9BURK|nr:hypothetical protein [Paraburkholderia silvatlantica]PYE21331.1 hypothetical protein C7410_115174 [Paraburkholderia silvatlantica]
MDIAIEPFTRVLADEITPLGQESWDECSEIKKDTCAYHGQRGLQIDPDIDQYLYLAEHQSLISMTLRDDGGVLRGYALAILYKSLHLRTELCGNVDTFYVQPDFRKYMPRFMSQLEDALRERGISIVGWPVTRTGKLYEILQRRGYIADDVVMELKIKDIKKE